MSSQNFTNFNLRSTPLSGDYIVGYACDGSAELRTTVNDLANTILPLRGYPYIANNTAILPIAGTNTASGAYSDIAGGNNNSISGTYNNIGGGEYNNITNSHNVIAGGCSNTASGGYSVVGGGDTNCNQGSCGVIAGGTSNYIAAADASVIVGGENNCIQNCNTFNNQNDNSDVFLGGGNQNCITNSGNYGLIKNTAIVGGGNNTICGNNTSANYSFIGAGESNIINNCYSSIVGGYTNTINSSYSYIAGGYYNSSLSADNTFILGSRITATSANYTYVNNISSQGTVAASTVTIGIKPTVTSPNVSPLTIVSTASGSIFNQIQNTFTGLSASTDISLYNDLGTNYLDMGIASSIYNGNLYGPKFNVVGANDSYLYATSANLAYGTTGSTGDLLFFTGGSLSGTSVNSGNERLRIKNTNAVGNGGFVGINTSVPNQQLTVSGSVSSTGFVSTSALWVSSLSATTGSPTTVAYKMPVYLANGTFAGWIPVYNG